MKMQRSCQMQKFLFDDGQLVAPSPSFILPVHPWGACNPWHSFTQNTVCMCISITVPENYDLISSPLRGHKMIYMLCLTVKSRTCWDSNCLETPEPKTSSYRKDLRFKNQNNHTKCVKFEDISNTPMIFLGVIHRPSLRVPCCFPGMFGSLFK